MIKPKVVPPKTVIYKPASPVKRVISTRIKNINAKHRIKLIIMEANLINTNFFI